MKIAYLHYLYGEQSGLRHVRQFAQAARSLGCDIEVHDMHPGVPEAGEGGGQAPVRLRLRQVLKRHLSWYLHEPKELLLTVPYWRKEIPLLRSSPPDVLLVRSSALNLSCIPVARRLGLPLVIELNSPPEEARVFHDQYWHIPFSERIEVWKLRRADGLVVVSSWLKNRMVDHYGLEAERITVSPNGADIRLFRPDADGDPGIPEAFQGAPVVGFVGSFLKWHGSDLLGRMALEIAAARPDVRFLFVGDGPGAAAVQQTTAPLGERVLFTGWVPHDRVPGLVASMDIAVMPESNPHGSPLKVIEWMAASKAVVAPRYVPLEDVIEHGVEGLLFPPQDDEALLRAVLRLVDDTELRRSLGRAATDRVLSSLTWEHNARRVLTACEQALARHASSRSGTS